MLPLDVTVHIRDMVPAVAMSSEFARSFVPVLEKSRVLRSMPRWSCGATCRRVVPIFAGVVEGRPIVAGVVEGLECGLSMLSNGDRLEVGTHSHVRQQCLARMHDLELTLALSSLWFDEGGSRL